MLAHALIAGLLALAPAIPCPRVGERWLHPARDLWLYALAWVGAGWIGGQVPALGVLGAAVLLHWRGPDQLPAVLTWVGIAATWALVGQVPPAMLPWIPAVWLALAVVQVAVITGAWWRGAPLCGTLGPRTLVAAYLALVTPFAPWYLWPVLAWGFWVSFSWLALLAGAVGVMIRWPAAALVLVPTLTIGVIVAAHPWTRQHCLGRTPRGASTWSLGTRWHTWQALGRITSPARWLIGWGPDLERRQALAAQKVLTPQHSLIYGALHCEPLELVATYGVAGLVAMGLLAWQLGPRLSWGDPWTASAVAGLLLAGGSIPCRVAPVGLTWLVTLAVIGSRP